MRRRWPAANRLAQAPRGLVLALLGLAGLVPASAFAGTIGSALHSAGATDAELTLSPLCTAASPVAEDAVDPLEPTAAKDAAPAPAIAPSVRAFDRPARTPVYPSLNGAGDSGGLVITGSLVPGILASTPAGGFVIDDVLCMTPTQTTPAETEATVVNGDSALYANSAPDTDTIVRPTATGVTVVESLRGAEAPTSFGWKLGVPPANRLRPLSNGGVAIEDPSRAAPAPHATPDEPPNVEQAEAIPNVATQLAESRYEIARAQRETGRRVAGVVSPPYAADSSGDSKPATLSPIGADALTVASPPGAEALVLTVAANPARARAPKPKAPKPKPPQPVNAYPLIALPGDLATEAANAACSFARSQPRGERLLILNFGRAHRHGGEFGAGHRPFYSNADILAALRAAASGYRHSGCHRHGRRAIIAYGLGNYKLSSSGDDEKPMSARLAKRAGVAQVGTAWRLRQSESPRDDAAVAGDIEPGWDPSEAGVEVGKALVRGADTHHLRYYDFGTAGHCPPYRGRDPGCGSWTFHDLGDVSQRHMAVALPEIYHAYQAKQWARVRRRWDGERARSCTRDRSPGCYSFAGATAQPKACGSDFSPARSWTTLRVANPAGSVARELVYYNPGHLAC